MRRWLVLPELPLVFVLAITALCRPAHADAVDASIRHLRRAVVAQRDGSHLRLLFSLRQLHDPALQPLFHQLARHAEWQVQVHAVLGLAEIEGEGTVDPWLVARADPLAQEQIVLSALDMDLIKPPQMEELLTREDLAPAPRVILIGELMLLGRAPDLETLTRLANSPDEQVRGIAACLLAQADDDAAFSSYRQRLQDMPRRDRNQRMLWIFDIIRQYRITALLDWVRQQIERDEADEDIVYWGIFTVLRLDPSTGVTMWARHLGEAPRHGKAVRYALLLLESEADIPAAAYDRLDAVPAQDGLLQQMAEAGRAMSSGTGIVGALTDLLDMGHLKSTRWAMSVVENLDTEQATRVYLHVIDSVEENLHQPDRVALGVQASAALFERNPRALRQRLAGVEDDSLTQQAILLGLFETPSAEAGEAAARLRRIGSGRADSLTLLLIAKHRETLSDEDRRHLGRIAAGGGRVSDVLQTQAAWLYLKHRGEVEHALSRVFADS